jgi:hypothetical protein
LLCIAGDREGDIASSTTPAAGASGWSVVTQPAGASGVLGVACAATVLCVGANAGNVASSLTPTAGTVTWTPAALPTRFQVLAASCPGIALCVLSTNNGEITASTNPAAGALYWLSEHLIKGVTNALFGLSCPDESLCVAGGKFGQLLTSTDPAATGLVAPAPPRPPGTRLLGRRRRLIRLQGRRTAASVSFRFAATGIATYYRCQLDSNHSGLCTSPRRYRVGIGGHSFRVRAFGPGGGDPTPGSFRFRVVRMKPKPRPKGGPPFHRHRHG